MIVEDDRTDDPPEDLIFDEEEDEDEENEEDGDFEAFRRWREEISDVEASRQLPILLIISGILKDLKNKNQYRY